jgi:hypothetical protein
MKEELNLSIEDHNNATIEISFLLNLFSKAISEIIGNAVSSIGISSGREFAKKMPILFDSTNMKDSIDKLTKYLQGGFDISSELSENQINFTFSRCALKNICQLKKDDLGGYLCKLFHLYMNGIIIQITKKNLKMAIIKTGDECCVNHIMI